MTFVNDKLEREIYISDMKAMILNKLGKLSEQSDPLVLVDLPIPVPSAEEVLVKVAVCGVCHTELDEIEGRTPPPALPIILGHQVVGWVEKTGKRVTQCKVGDRVGIAWIFSACGHCAYCLSGQENLCPEFRATGRDAHGGYAEYMTVPEKYTYIQEAQANSKKYNRRESLTFFTDAHNSKIATTLDSR